LKAPLHHAFGTLTDIGRIDNGPAGLRREGARAVDFNMHGLIDL
jgi:hypothetical protein